MNRIFVLLLPTALLIACGGPPSDADVAAPVLGGALTDARPEIGRIHLPGGGACTATLIGPRVVITAAHCVDHASADRPADYGRFVVDRPGEGSFAYTIERLRSFGATVGADDLALLALATPVPPRVAVPTFIEPAEPPAGSPITIFGYGCLDRQTHAGDFRKRAYDHRYAPSRNLCPGDSGGPVTLGRRGGVLLINSGYSTHSGEDVFGRPFERRAELEAQIWAWGLEAPPRPPEPEPRREPGAQLVHVSNATGVLLWVRCRGERAPGCSDWLGVHPDQIARVETRDGSMLLRAHDDRRVLFSDAHVRVLGDRCTVYANPDNPFSPPAEPEPAPGRAPEPYAADEDGDGVFDVNDACSHTAPGWPVAYGGFRAGCADHQLTDREDGDRDGVPDAYDRCPRTPLDAEVWRSGAFTGCAGGEVPAW